MGLYLRDDVYYCLANSKVVLLDLAADRYLALPDAANQAFRNLAAGGSLTETDEQALAPHVRSGLFARGNAELVPPPNISPPCSSGLDWQMRSPRLFSLLNAWHRQRQATQALERLGLRSVITQIKADKAAMNHFLSSGQMAIPEVPLAAFLRLRRHMNTHDQCLRRSLGLMRLMACHGFYPTLVIGVRMKPFEAHAWVQWRDVVLNDTVDQVSRYTPILAV